MLSTAGSIALQREAVDREIPHPSLSTDRRYVAFESDASSLDGADTNLSTDIFVRRR